MNLKSLCHTSLLLAALAQFALAQPAPWQRPFYFVIMADPQVGWNQGSYNSEELFEVAVEEANKLHPDFVLIAGDLVQSSGSNEQYEITKAIADGMEMPYYVVPGNHDVSNPPTMAKLKWYMEKWDVPLWYTFTYLNTVFPMVETNTLRARYHSGVESEIVDLAKEQLVWLDDTLADLRRDGWKHVYPVGHHPLAKNSIDEDGSSQNFPKDVRSDLLEIYQRHNITTVFAGHAHHTALLTDGDLDLVTYASTGVILGGRDPSGFAIVKINGDQMEQKYYGYADLPKDPIESDNPGFTVTFPDTGALLLVGSQETITWDSESMSRDVVLEYTLNGSDWVTIADSAPNNGSYIWTVPEETSEYLRVRVSSRWDESISGESSEPSSIVTTGTGHFNPGTCFTFGFNGAPALFTGLYRKYQVVSIYNLAGSLVRQLPLQPGLNTWNGLDANRRKVPGGLYLVRFLSEERGGTGQTVKAALSR